MSFSRAAINFRTVTNSSRRLSDEIEWGSSGADAEFLRKLRRQLAKIDEKDRIFVLHLARKMVSRG
jgi:hypothetical protein